MVDPLGETMMGDKNTRGVAGHGADRGPAGDDGPAGDSRPAGGGSQRRDNTPPL